MLFILHISYMFDVVFPICMCSSIHACTKCFFQGVSQVFITYSTKSLYIIQYPTRSSLRSSYISSVGEDNRFPQILNFYPLLSIGIQRLGFDSGNTSLIAFNNARSLSLTTISGYTSSCTSNFCRHCKAQTKLSMHSDSV